MSFLLSKMCSLAAAGDFRGVVDLCEEKEVELAANEMERATAGEWPYAGQMLAHLIIDDLCGARFVYKRCPQSIRAANIDVKNAFVILQHLWTNEFGAAYRFVCACLSASDLKDERENEAQSNSHGDSRSMIQMLMRELRDRIRTNVIELIELSYSSISIQTLVDMMGIGIEDAGLLDAVAKEEVLTEISRLGWKYDNGNGIVTIIPTQRERNRSNNDISEISNLEHLQQLTEYACGIL